MVLILNLFYPEIIDKYFMQISYIWLGQWCRNIIQIQLDFICKQKFNYFNISNIVYFGSLIVYILAQSVVEPYIGSYTFFTGLAIIEIAILVYTAVLISLEAADVLGIYLFSVDKKNK